MADRSGGALVCYCFGHTRAAIEQEVRALGTSPTVARVRELVTMGRCDCALQHPAGRCCLGDLRRVVEETMVESAER